MVAIRDDGFGTALDVHEHGSKRDADVGLAGRLVPGAVGGGLLHLEEESTEAGDLRWLGKC
jgi:hypothetical protein